MLHKCFVKCNHRNVIHSCDVIRPVSRDLLEIILCWFETFRAYNLINNFVETVKHSSQDYFNRNYKGAEFIIG